MAMGTASRERKGAEDLRDFLPSLAIGLRPKPLSGRGHVPSANLQDFRPPNERASVCGRSSEDCGQTADQRLSLTLVLRVRQRTAHAARSRRQFAPFGGIALLFRGRGVRYFTAFAMI
jgi:hypothetical protein